jgi:uncharacterized lipoprotein YddW (UPF0748 family)
MQSFTRAALTISLLFLFSLTSSGADAAKQQAGPIPEVRALWVDGFNPGIRTSEEAQRLVADAKKAGFNTLFVQVRRRADSLYKGSAEPAVEDFEMDPSFDPLQNIIDLAHKEGIEVHAWVNAMTVWKNQAPPKSPTHIFNLHGPAQSGRDNWLTANPAGQTVFPVGYFLDPGHPDAMDYLVGVYANIARKYAIDGIHFDYIRYPETEEKPAQGSGVGYNPVSIERFRRSTGRSDTPSPGDPQWMEWRRQQVSQLVRRVYLEVKAINPRIKVSAATIAWGKPPVKSFEEAAPMQLVYQDWNGWMRNGFLDMAVPMNYARESDPRVSGYFTGWVRWEKEHKFGRQLVVGVGSYLNPADGTLAQLKRVRDRAARNTSADGVSFFSYASFLRAAEKPAATAFECLYTGPQAPFAASAVPPRAVWLEQPSTGWLAGIARDKSGKALDSAPLEIRRAGRFPFRHKDRVLTDGNGFFGMSAMKPGKYEVLFTSGGARTRSLVEVSAGRVARVELNAN